MKHINDKCIKIALLLLILYANYFAIVNKFLPGFAQDLFVVAAVLLGLLPFLANNAKVFPRQQRLMILWILLLFEAVFNRNQDVSNGSFLFVIRIFAGIAIIAYSQNGSSWPRNGVDMACRIGYLNVFATYVFLLVPSLYRIMPRFYGAEITGTNHGMAGYRAGIANHYSQNGTCISFVFLYLAASWLFYLNKKRSISRKLSIPLLLTFAALILTTKRAHFLFCVVTAMAVYYVANPKKRAGKMFKIFLIVSGGAIAFYVSSFFLDPVRALMLRFSTIGGDAQSLARFRMWDLGFKLFRSSPVFGIGWGGFKYQYATHLYKSWQDIGSKYLNAHNTYIQLLCETGITGLLIYLLAAFGTLVYTIRGAAACIHSDGWKQRVLYISIAFQVFVLLYNLTGNTLYDYTVFFYAMGVAAGLAVCRLEKV